MAKAKKEKTKREAKPADPNILRRVTVHSVLGKANGSKESFRVYGVAKKAISKDTPFGVAHGLKGAFEVLKGGKIVASKQAFLGSDAQKEIADKLENGDAVQFGAEVSRDGEAVSVSFFVDPSAADALTSLREAAQE